MLRHANLCLSSVALALLLCLGTSSSALAQYGTSVDIHADGYGATYRSGNQTFVERMDGPSTLIQRVGDWDYRQMSNGVYGAFHYDRVNGVTKFDFRDPRTGRRVIGVNPNPSNPYVRPWSFESYNY